MRCREKGSQIVQEKIEWFEEEGEAYVMAMGMDIKQHTHIIHKGREKGILRQIETPCISGALETQTCVIVYFIYVIQEMVGQKLGALHMMNLQSLPV